MEDKNMYGNFLQNNPAACTANFTMNAQEELYCVLRNIFRICKTCLEDGDQHFKTPL
jgi:hypothetical protein